MTTGKTIDREALHDLLWASSGRGGRLTVKQKDLAQETGINQFHLSRVFKDFVEAGRMRKLEWGKSNVATYVIANPDEWRSSQASPAL